MIDSKLLTAFALLWATSTSNATTCVGPPPTTLAKDYQSAADIYVGEVVGCAGGHVPERGKCPDELYQVQVVEVLKDKHSRLGPFSNLQGGRRMGCGLQLVVGVQYLFFTDAMGGLHPSSQSLAGGRGMTKTTRERRRVLAAYRDGIADDLSEPWFFSEIMYTCSLNHRVGKSGLSFSYHYGSPVPLTGTLRSVQLWDEDGNIGRDLVRVAEPRERSAETALTGPKFEHPQLIFNVSLDTDARTIDNSASVRIGDRQWSLLTSRLTTPIAGREPHVHVRQLIGGDAAEEIFDAMRDPVDVLVTMQSADDVGQRSPTGTDPRTTIETRTTHIGEKMEAFLACVDGTNRNPPRIRDAPPN